MKIAYAGYDLLVNCLNALQEAQYEIIKIFTFLSKDPYDQSEQIIGFGERFGIPVQTEPISIADLDHLLSTDCDVLICAGYPYRVPIHPDMHSINIHPAILPVGRSPWPMPVTILKGLPASGVTIHKLSEQFDAGDILMQESFEVDERETLLTINQKIQRIAEDMLVRCMSHFHEMYEHAIPQNETEQEYWKDPTDLYSKITLEMSDDEIDRRLRAFAGYGCTVSDGKQEYSVDFIQFREIELSDMDGMNHIRQQYHNMLSAYTFPCIYCWRRIQKLEIYMESDWFVIRCDESDYYYPCGNPVKTELFIRVMRFIGKAFRMGYITKQAAEQLKDEHKELYLAEDRANYDYIVPMKQIAELSGKHFHTIRKEIHQFERSGDLEIEEITEENVYAVEELAIKWSKLTTGMNDFADTIAEESAVRHFTKLRMQGILAKKDGVYFGFVMGTAVNENTIDAHFAKCIDKSPGADFYCKQQFCERFATQYEYMNMEEDMGIEGIRMRKLLFRPTSLTPVFLADFQNKDGDVYEQE